MFRRTEKKYLSIILLFLCLQAHAISDDCQKWFDKLNFKKNKSCEITCKTEPVDLSSFTCHDECDQLCNSPNQEISYSLLKTYGLTEDEIKICDKTPIVCVQAYLLSWKAEKTCLSIYSKSKTNDESDACRHFVWSILLAKEFGADTAEKILNAHENNSLEPEEERAMDLSNNRLGLLNFQRLSKSNKFEDADIIDLFKTRLSEKSLIILKPSYKSKGGLP